MQSLNTILIIFCGDWISLGANKLLPNDGVMLEMMMMISMMMMMQMMMMMIDDISLLVVICTLYRGFDLIRRGVSA